MKQATFEFQGDLVELLTPAQRRGEPFACLFRGRQSVKHLIESLSVPHTEVGGILVNGQRVGFGYLVQNGDRVLVQPLSPDTTHMLAGAPLTPPEGVRFVLDNHLGRLAVYLRLFGFDTLYNNDYQDEELAQVASEQQRILLTRDRRLLMRNSIPYGCLVRSKTPRQQLLQVVRRYHLGGQIQPFKRCLRCNGLLQPVDKAEVLQRLKPLTRLYYDDFRMCQDCQQVYWPGSHYQRMQKLVEQVRESV
jgi:uncharacterized protein with PIN domain